MQDQLKRTELKRLDAIIGRINTHPEYSGCVKENALYVFQKQAARHSTRMEDRSSSAPLSSEHDVLILRNLCSAWQYLASHELSAVNMAQLGHLIEPESPPGYRKRDVSSRGLQVPAIDQVPIEIENLVYRLTSGHAHPVLLAADAHMDIVRIQPFPDGNHRAARLVQNFYLQEHGYPAAVIPHTDQGIYLGLLERAIVDRVRHESTADTPSTNERLFQDFIISKVLASAAELEQQLQHKRMYEVVLEKVKNMGVAYDAAHQVRGYRGSHPERPIKVHVQRHSAGSRSVLLKVEGDISAKELKELLSRTHSRFSIECIVGKEEP